MTLLSASRHYYDRKYDNIEAYIYAKFATYEEGGWDNFMADFTRTFMPQQFAVNKQNPSVKETRMYAFADRFVTGGNFDPVAFSWDGTNYDSGSQRTSSIWALDFGSRPSDCKFISVFLISYWNGAYDQNFYYEPLLMQFGLDSQIKTVFQSASNIAALGKVGAENHHIRVYNYPDSIECKNLWYGQMMGTSGLVQIAGGVGSSNGRAQTDYQNSFSPSAVVRRYGLVCTSLTATSPCTLQGAVGSQQWSGGSKFLYIATTTSKYTAASVTTDDGIREYPTTGTVTQTNSGKTSIVIAGNAKFGDTTLSYPTTLHLLKVDRGLYDGGPSNGHSGSGNILRQAVDSQANNMQCQEMDFN